MRPAVFLDRDGTLIAEVGNLGDPARASLLPGVPAALRQLRDADYALIVVTNQGGVARGLFGEEAVRAVNARVAELLGEAGVLVDGWYFCPHHPEFTGTCECRKPEPGMLRRAADELALDLPASWMVGDHPTDAEAARRAGARPIIVRTGVGSLPGWDADPGPGVPVVDDLPAAADLILGTS